MKMKLGHLWKLKIYICKHKIYSLLIVILALAKAITSLIPVHLLGAIINSLATRNAGLDLSPNISYLLFFSFAIFINYAINNVYGYLTFIFTDTIINDLRNDAMDWVLHSYKPLNEEKKDGDIVSRLTGDIDLVSQTLASPLNNLLPLVTKFSISLWTLFFWSSMMGFVAVVLIVPIFFSSHWIANKSKNIVYEQRIMQGKLVDSISNVLESMPVVIAWCAENDETYNLCQCTDNVLALKKSLHTKYMLYWFITLFMSGVGLVFSVLWAYKLVLTGNMSVGGIMVAYNYMQNVLTPISSFTRYSRDLHQADVALARIFELQRKPHCHDENVEFDEAPDIVFQNVCICCNDNHILENINFIAKSKSLTVLSGPSGIGKSTLLHAAIGFHPLKNGCISIGGVAPQCCIQSIGIAFQRDYLLDRSIRENIAFGEMPNDSRIYNVAKEVGFLEILLERGANFIVGNHGNRLSGGERRKVALARALYCPKLCYIFDEPTAELDELSKSKIVNLLNELRKNATVLITSHDEDVLAIADQVVYVNEFLRK